MQKKKKINKRADFLLYSLRVWVLVSVTRASESFWTAEHLQALSSGASSRSLLAAATAEKCQIA